MARTYAGILGPLALSTSLAIGVLRGEPPEAVLLTAWLSLLVFSAIGYVVGRIAEQTVEESVRAGISANLRLEERGEPSAATPRG